MLSAFSFSITALSQTKLLLLSLPCHSFFLPSRHQTTKSIKQPLAMYCLLRTINTSKHRHRHLTVGSCSSTVGPVVHQLWAERLISSLPKSGCHCCFTSFIFSHFAVKYDEQLLFSLLRCCFHHVL